jgi:hypothetical protein
MIPQVTIKTGLTTPNGREEVLAEYLCDHPGCPNIATQVLGCLPEIHAVAVVCDEHAPEQVLATFSRNVDQIACRSQPVRFDSCFE